VTAQAEDYPAGWLTQFRRGVVAGVVLLIRAILLAAIPTFVAWFAPGADSTSAGSALRTAMLVAISGNHGGFVLDGTSVTLTPLLVTGMLGWLVASNARRVETTSGFLGLVVGYPLATAVATRWARFGETGVPLFASTLAAGLFVLLVGGLARFAPDRYHRLAPRWQRVGRAALVAMLVYLVAGALLAATMLVAHLHGATMVQARLATGAGGLPVTLIGIAAVPNAVLAAVGYLAGPGFAVGGHTSVSMFAVHHGPLPLFPMLAGLPSGPPATALGVSIGVLTAAVAGWASYRLVSRGDDVRTSLLVLADLLTAAVLAGLGLAVLSTLAAGSLGAGALQHIGSTGWLVGCAAASVVTVASAGWLGIDKLRHRSSARRPAAALAVIAGDGTSDGDGAGGGVDADEPGERSVRPLLSTG
jgi:hypothetical protein